MRPCWLPPRPARRRRVGSPFMPIWTTSSGRRLLGGWLIRTGMEISRGTAFALVAAAALLLWPAVWNHYPVVFADTGTYLSQAIHLYAGWDRPVFYSLLIRPLHLKTTLWPIVLAQSV